MPTYPNGNQLGTMERKASTQGRKRGARCGKGQRGGTTDVMQLLPEMRRELVVDTYTTWWRNDGRYNNEEESRKNNTDTIKP